MSSEHSPAPWTLTPDSFVMSGTHPQIGVARIITHTKEFPANAQLICAAPSLLWCCKKMLDAYDRREVIPDGWVRAIRAAVAQAEGNR